MSRANIISAVGAALAEAHVKEAEAKRLGHDSEAAWWGAHAGPALRVQPANRRREIAEVEQTIAAIENEF